MHLGELMAHGTVYQRHVKQTYRQQVIIVWPSIGFFSIRLATEASFEQLTLTFEEMMQYQQGNFTIANWYECQKYSTTDSRSRASVNHAAELFHS